MITRLFYKIAKSKIPSMSQTEQIALEAGDTWIEKELFSGKPNWEKVKKINFSKLTQEEQNFLDQETEDLCKLINDWKITHEDKDLPKEVWEFLKTKGFFGLVISKQYGGKGFSAAAHSAIVLKISTRSFTAAVTAMVPNSLGPAELLFHYGTEDQKNYYLPRLAKGEEIPCFGLTSLYAGSDAGAMIDEGIISYGDWKGEKILGIKIHASKRYITLAPIATLIGLAFKLKDPEGLLGGEQELGITLALLSPDMPGVKTGKRHFPLNIPFMNGPVEIQDAFIPLNFIIGGKDQIGQGWKMLMECLSIGRSISLPAVATASAAVAVVACSAYTQVRKQFKLPLYKFEGIQEKLARIGGLAYAIEATRQMTLTAVDHGKKPSVASAIAKYHMTEMSRIIFNDAMDIHGGKGIILGPKNYLARAYQGIPIGITVEGANILTRSLMIFGQGSIRCHEYLLDLFKSLSDEDKGDKENKNKFKKVFYKFIGGAFANIFRAIGQGLTAGWFIKIPDNSHANSHSNLHHNFQHRTYQQISRLSTALALASDIALLVLGGKLKRRESLSARLGDVLSYLYISTSVLKLWENSNYSEEEAPLAEYAIKHCLYEAQEALYNFYRNFPIKFLGYWLRRRSFFWGKIFTPPSDYLASQVVKALIEKNSVCQRFADLCYLDPLDAGSLGDLFKNYATQDPSKIAELLSVDAFENL